MDTVQKNTNIGQKIKKIRELRNYTQEYMAQELGISQNGYGKMERNEVNVNYERLQEIATILNVKPDELINFDEGKIFMNMPQNYDQSNNNHGIVYNSGFEKERKLYEEQISQLKNENGYLKEIIETLKGQLGHLQNLHK